MNQVDLIDWRFPYISYGVPRPTDEIRCPSTPYIKASSRGSHNSGASGYSADISEQEEIFAADATM